MPEKHFAYPKHFEDEIGMRSLPPTSDYSNFF
jgi:hypothetical protein